MSGYQRPPGVATVVLRLPRVPSQGNGFFINQAFTLLEGADTQNLKRGQELALPSVLLTSPNGGTWRLTVDNAGNLTLAQVAR